MEKWCLSSFISAVETITRSWLWAIPIALIVLKVRLVAMAFKIFCSLNKAQETWSEGHCSASSDVPVSCLFVLFAKDAFSREWAKEDLF